MRTKTRLLILLTVLSGLAVLLFLFWHVREKGSEKPVVICMGDSLTESEFGYYPRHLAGLLKRKGINTRVVTAARPGNTSGEYLNYLRQSGLLDRVQPDVVVIMLGTNDVRIDRDATPTDRFRENITGIIRLIKKPRFPDSRIPVIFLATIPPIDRIDLRTFDDSSAKRVENEIIPAIREVARMEGVSVLDIHGFFRERPDLLAGIHPRKKGYYAMSVFIFEAILPVLEKI